MRITVLRQMTGALPIPDPAPDVEDDDYRPGLDPTETDATLERVKYFLWQGNTFRALDLLGDLHDDLELLCAGPCEDRHRAFFTRLAEFRTYIGRNAAQIPNYGERHRAGEPVSSATAESTVNQVISRRMVKKQQMRWTSRGAHLLLQIRTRVLNDDLIADFARWYPGSPGTDRRTDGFALAA
jgi:hypothetical protein